MIYSHSNVETWEQCPKRWKYRYIDNIQAKREPKPDDALILGTTLHEGIEKGVQAAEKFYYSNFDKFEDAQLEQWNAVKLRIEKAREMIPAGEYERKIEGDQFVGYADLLTPVELSLEERDTICENCERYDKCDECQSGKCPYGKYDLYDLYDFKYSNNVDRYLESRQLHEYRYYLEAQGVHINDMYFVICGKGKRNESVKLYKVDYSQDKISEFFKLRDEIERATEYPAKPSKLCAWCDYRSMCTQGRQMIINNKVIEKERNNMATRILVLGESGTGKSASLRNFKRDEVAYVNVSNKPLPFRGGFSSTISGTDFDAISKFMRSAKEPVIVVDDAQFIMSYQYMNRLKEKGWDKYNEFQSDFFNIIELSDELPKDKTVYYLSHIQTNDDGDQKIKTIGKMLDEKITIEAMFTIVLKTLVTDGKYYFATQNNGHDTIKSPMGMFDSYAIDNDLKLVDDVVRNYYDLSGAKTDAEVDAAKTEATHDEVRNPIEGRKRRERKTEDVQQAVKEHFEEVAEKAVEQLEDNTPITGEDKPKRRTRRVRTND